MKSVIVYRLYTEANWNLVTLIQDAGFIGATVFAATGLYDGKIENAAVIEIVADDSRDTKQRIATLASLINTINNQAEVMVTSSTHGLQIFKALGITSAMSPTPNNFHVGEVNS